MQGDGRQRNAIAFKEDREGFDVDRKGVGQNARRAPSGLDLGRPAPVLDGDCGGVPRDVIPRQRQALVGQASRHRLFNLARISSDVPAARCDRVTRGQRRGHGVAPAVQGRLRRVQLVADHDPEVGAIHGISRHRDARRQSM